MVLSIHSCIFVALTIITVATTVSAALTSSEEKELVQAHNHFRRKVDPLATNMLKMVRNTILEHYTEGSLLGLIIKGVP